VRRLHPEIWRQRTGCCITTTHHLTLPFWLWNLWPETAWLSSPHTLLFCFIDLYI
jgi:hypothetical protein